MTVEPSLLWVRTIIKKGKTKEEKLKRTGKKKKGTGEPEGDEKKKEGRRGGEVIWKQPLLHKS